ncbi:MAG: ABC transporter permease [Oscillospiraceae bacterium]|jgi:ABC-type antimicrobial peptide transport system permease subunit|nr:ABC transporter permease [Oscillospiraceae bacterium]
MNFSYGLYQNYNTVKDEKESDLYDFEIAFNQTDEKYVTQEMLKTAALSLQPKTTETINVFYTEYNVIELDGKIGRANFTVKDGKFVPCETLYENLVEFLNWISGDFFSQTQEENGEKVCLAFGNPDTTISNLTDFGYDKTIISKTDENGNESDYLTINNVEYKIIGYQKLRDFIIPFNSMDGDIKLGGSLIMNFDKPMTRTQYEDIKYAFESTMGELCSVPLLDIPESENYYLYNTIIIISILIAVLAAINFSALYKYVLTKRTKTLAIFRMCGLKKSRAMTMFLTECMVITIPIFAVSTLIYSNLLLPIFAEKFKYISDAYSLGLYLLIFAIYVLSSLIVLFIMIHFSFLNKSLASTEKEAN